MLPLITLMMVLGLVSQSIAHEFTESRIGTIKSAVAGCERLDYLSSLTRLLMEKNTTTSDMENTIGNCRVIAPNAVYAIVKHSEDHKTYRVRFLSMSPNGTNWQLITLYVPAYFFSAFQSEKSQ